MSTPMTAARKAAAIAPIQWLVLKSSACDCGNNYGRTCCGATEHTFSFPYAQIADLVIRIESTKIGVRIVAQQRNNAGEPINDSLEVNLDFDYLAVIAPEITDLHKYVTTQALWIRRLYLNNHHLLDDKGRCMSNCHTCP